MSINKTLLYPPLMALALLTRLPVTRYLPEQWEGKHQGLSILWYPAVGLLLALILSFTAVLIPAGDSPLLISVCVVVAWVMLTGALHLDGLADSIDAVFAAHGELSSPEQRQKILTVFKDPAAGPMAVVGLILVLLLKVVLVSDLSEFPP